MRKDSKRTLQSMTDTMTPFAPPERWVPVDGALNLRDLGGYLTPSGARVRWRRLFRSDALDGLTGDDQRYLRERLGARTVIDLCADGEGAHRTPWAPSRLDLPLVDRAAVDVLAAPSAPLHDVYLDLLRRRASELRSVVEAVVEGEHPLVVTCTDGNDRAGLVSAVLLGALGVSDDDIVRDYSLTNLALSAIHERLRRRDDPVVTRRDCAEPEAMRTTLRVVRQEHGSMLGYVLDLGVSAESVAMLRDRLLD